MITIKLLGGLGNQMFQRAFGIALGQRGYQVQYDRSSLVEGTHREYSLGYFGTLPLGGWDGSCIGVYEKGMPFNPEYLAPPDPTIMVGYWQSEKYFLDIADEIRQAFPLLRAATERNTIALHVRRQDYVRLQHFHGMPGLDYYREAVAYIRREVGRLCPVMIFSDDHQWCRENFPYHTIFEGENKYEDLAMMAACDYHVVANSSFSWWGAWLGPQKLVVAPKQWFVDPAADAKDLVPERWVRL